MMIATMQSILEKLRAQRGKRGFTFTEVLVALLIMVLLATFVAQSIPVAFNTYRQVVGDVNAQAALTTTASALRDELGLAVDAKPGKDGALFYQMSDGSWAMIDNEKNGTTSVGLVKHVYAASGSFNPMAPGTEIEAVDLVPAASIKGASGGDEVRVQLTNSSGGSTISYSNGVFTVHRLEALIGGESIEHIDDYKIKAVLDPKS